MHGMCLYPVWGDPGDQFLWSPWSVLPAYCEFWPKLIVTFKWLWGDHGTWFLWSLLWKKNSVLSNKLLSKSLYVHVLVTFVVTFGRSGAYQHCYCMVDCRRPYSPEKLILDPFPGKRKGKGKGQNCWSWPFWFTLLYFNLVVKSKTWCTFVVGILRRFICNLGCVCICLLYLDEPVLK